MKRLFALLLSLAALMPVLDQAALACACCTPANQLLEFAAVDQLGFAQGAKLKGQMGLVTPGGEDLGIDVGAGEISGQISQGVVSLSLSRNGKVLGTLTLKPKAQAVHRQLDLDFVLSPAELAHLSQLELASDVYHQISLPVSVEASPALKSALGVAFSPQAILKFHGRSNACWSPAEYGGQWSLNYAVSAGKVLESALARGTVVPAN